MKMRKLLSLLVSVVILLSIASVSYAATVIPPDVNENPTVYVQVMSVMTEGGQQVATLKFSIKTDKEFKPTAIVAPNYTTTFQNTYTGRGIIGYDVVVNLNTNYFGDIMLATSPFANANGTTNGASDARFSAGASSYSSWFTDNPGDFGIIRAPLKDASLTADDLNAKNDLLSSYGYCSVTIAEYADGATKGDSNGYAYKTIYTANGTGEYKDYNLNLVTSGPNYVPDSGDKVDPIEYDPTTPAVGTNGYSYWVSWEVEDLPAEMTTNGVKATLSNDTLDQTLDTDIPAEEFTAFGGGNISFTVWALIREAVNDTYSLVLSPIEATE